MKYLFEILTENLKETVKIEESNENILYSEKSSIDFLNTKNNKFRIYPPTKERPPQKM